MNRDDKTGLDDDLLNDTDYGDTGLSDQDDEARRNIEEGFYDETK